MIFTEQPQSCGLRTLEKSPTLCMLTFLYLVPWNKLEDGQMEIPSHQMLGESCMYKGTEERLRTGSSAFVAYTSYLCPHESKGAVQSLRANESSAQGWEDIYLGLTFTPFSKRSKGAPEATEESPSKIQGAGLYINISLQAMPQMCWKW